jgi:Patatin-like phospholipase
MSFGFSVGDLIADSRLRSEVYRTFEDNPLPSDLEEAVLPLKENQKALGKLQESLHLYRTTSQTSADYENGLKRSTQDSRHAPYGLPSTIGSICSEPGADRRKPWHAKNVLCLDSGGVRGVSSLLILRELMAKIAEHEHQIEPKAMTSKDSPMVEAAHITPPSSEKTAYLPCHYFDYVAGTSTGGLIAIMLGRMRMSVEDAIRHFEEISPRLYQHHNKPSVQAWRSLLRPRSRSEGQKLNSTMQKIAPEETSLKSDSSMCRTIICSLQAKASRGSKVPYLFTSYGRNTFDTVSQDVPYGINLTPEVNSLGIAPTTLTIASMSRTVPTRSLSHPPDDVRLLQVARATSCSPLYFEPVRVGEYKYYDASISLSNPSLEVYREVNMDVAEDDSNQHLPAIDSFVSVGCGNSSHDAPNTFFQREKKLGKRALKLSKALSTSSEDVHYKMQALHDDTEAFSYYRFDAKTGLEGLRQLDPSNEPMHRRIKTATQCYIQEADVQKQLDDCAGKLVKLRRLRCNTSRWEAFAFGTRYKCKHDDETCDFQRDRRVVDRDELLDHLRMDHNMPPPDSVHYQEIKTLVEKGRTDSD